MFTIAIMRHCVLALLLLGCGHDSHAPFLGMGAPLTDAAVAVDAGAGGMPSRGTGGHSAAKASGGKTGTGGATSDGTGGMAPTDAASSPAWDAGAAADAATDAHDSAPSEPQPGAPCVNGACGYMQICVLSGDHSRSYCASTVDPCDCRETVTRADGNGDAVVCAPKGEACACKMTEADCSGDLRGCCVGMQCLSAEDGMRCRQSCSAAADCASGCCHAIQGGAALYCVSSDHCAVP